MTGYLAMRLIGLTLSVSLLHFSVVFCSVLPVWPVTGSGLTLWSGTGGLFPGRQEPQGSTGSYTSVVGTLTPSLQVPYLQRAKGNWFILNIPQRAIGLSVIFQSFGWIPQGKQYRPRSDSS